MTADDRAKQYLHSARSRSLTPADLVRIELREVKALAKSADNSNAGLYGAARKVVRSVAR